MRNAIQVIVMVGSLVMGSNVAAEEAQVSAEASELVDGRTEAQQRYDAAQEARDAAALEALKVRLQQGAATSSSGEASAEGPAEEVQLLPMTPAIREAALAPLRSAGRVAQDVEIESSTVFLLRGCYHVVFTFPDSGRPPRYHLMVLRLPAPDLECTSASRTLDSSYVDSVHVAVKGGQGIAISFASKQTPSGSGLVHVRLFQIAPKTLDVVRQEFLGTYLGSTYVNELHFEGNRLIVETNRYTATYPRFLTSGLPPEGVIFP